MPPKRNCGATSPSEPQVKMIKIGGDPDVQDFHSGSADRFRMAEESSSSPPPLPNTEQEIIDFDEDNFSASGVRTDTISLLMKIDQLQAQLKYERRCRILAERELRELREMNTLMLQMRHTAHELRVTLDHVLHGGQAEVASQNPEEVVTFLPEPEMQMTADDNISEEDGQNFVYLGESIRVPKNLYHRIAEIGDYKKYISALLMTLFDRHTLATHCLQSRKSSVGEESHKPALPPEILKGLMDHVAAKFGVDSNLIKTAIRTKLNNEDKLMKKRLGLNRSDSRVAVNTPISYNVSLLPKQEPMTNDSEF